MTKTLIRKGLSNRRVPPADHILLPGSPNRRRDAGMSIAATVPRSVTRRSGETCSECWSPIASILAQYVALKRTPETMNALFDQYSKLTPEDIRQAASKYLVESGRTIATLTGPGGSK